VQLCSSSSYSYSITLNDSVIIVILLRSFLLFIIPAHRQYNDNDTVVKSYKIGLQTRNGERTLVWRDNYESIRVTLAVIVLFTWRHSCSTVEPIPARQMLAQQLNHRNRKGRKTTRCDATWHVLSPSWIRLWLLHRREASLCGSSNESRQKEGRGNGQMFSSNPTCTIPLLFNTDDALTPSKRRAASEDDKGKALWGKFRQIPFSLESLHMYLMFNLSQLGVLIIDISRELWNVRYVADKILSMQGGDLRYMKDRLDLFWEWNTTKRVKMKKKSHLETVFVRRRKMWAFLNFTGL